MSNILFIDFFVSISCCNACFFDILSSEFMSFELISLFFTCHRLIIDDFLNYTDMDKIFKSFLEVNRIEKTPPFDRFVVFCCFLNRFSAILFWPDDNCQFETESVLVPRGVSVSGVGL